MNDEALADILAEMRNRADTVIEGRVITARNFVPQEAVEDWADRIEAAAERERAEIEADALAVGGIVEAARQKKVGNAAALREALERVEQSWLARGEDGSSLHAGDTLGIISSALSAPPRNCDKFATAEVARLAFWDTHETIWEAFKNRSGMALFYEVLNWLFAPAEGGAE